MFKISLVKLVLHHQLEEVCFLVDQFQVIKCNIDYIEIPTTGNALDFGDLTTGTSDGTGISNGHGGL